MENRLNDDSSQARPTDEKTNTKNGPGLDQLPNEVLNIIIDLRLTGSKRSIVDTFSSIQSLGDRFRKLVDCPTTCEKMEKSDDVGVCCMVRTDTVTKDCVVQGLSVWNCTCMHTWRSYIHVRTGLVISFCINHIGPCFWRWTGRGEQGWGGGT